MKVSLSKPPIYDECAKAFKLTGREIFTYGDTIYNPAGFDIPDHLLIHELTHREQQKHDNTVAKLWWRRYIDDPKWRIDQEVEAYAAQYAFICTKVKDKNARYKNLHLLAVDLASPMYGSSISYTDAIRRIRNG